MNFKSCFFITAMCILQTMQGQDTIVGFDQPGYTTSPRIVVPGSIQFEFGTSYNPITGIKETLFPSLMTRIPLAKQTELRLTINYEPQSNSFILDDVANDHDPVAIGIKQNIFQQDGKKPCVSVMGNVFHPVQRLDQVSTAELCADAWLLAEHGNDKNEFIYCTGYTRGNERLGDFMSWAFCYGYMITENICLFGEYFGHHYFETRITEHGFDTGATFETGNRFQVDVCYFDPSQHMGYISGGLAYNFSRFRAIK